MPAASNPVCAFLLLIALYTFCLSLQQLCLDRQVFICQQSAPHGEHRLHYKVHSLHPHPHPVSPLCSFVLSVSC